MSAGRVGEHPDGERDWLFDGVGEPDEEERRIAESLRSVRWQGDVDALLASLEGARGQGEDASHPPASACRARRVQPRAPVPAVRRWRRYAPVLAAACLALVAAVWGVLLRGSGSSWERSSGSAWPVGRWIETGSGAETLVASRIGRVTVGPGSRVRLVRAEEGEHRLELAVGSIDAFIYAPPRLFFVDTPAATAVDMGCAYTLDIAPDGTGLLRVSGGWVELKGRWGGGEGASPPASRVPAGAVCRIGTDGGPGVPCFEDAPAEFTEALRGLRRGNPGALERVLGAARPRDGLTLWHLIARTSGADRSRVVERLATLVPAAGVREGALRLEEEAMDAWWSAVRRAW